MSKLVWGATGERLYETGVQKGVLYTMKSGVYETGVVWNGLTSVSETPSGGDATALYADDIKYLTLYANVEYGGTIEAYMYPPEFAKCNGEAELEEGSGVFAGQQERSRFGLCYRTAIGNDVDANEHGYKLHLIYNAMATPSERSYASVNDSPEAITFSWEFTTNPVNVAGFKPTACLTIDSTKADPTNLAKLEEKLYGSESEEPTLPSPDEVMAIMKAAG